MDRKWNGKTFREIMQISSAEDFFKWLPENLISMVAGMILVIATLTPLYVIISAIKYPFYEVIHINYTDMLDRVGFAVVARTAPVLFVLAMGKLRLKGKESIRRELYNPVFVLLALLLMWMLISVFPVHGGTEYLMIGHARKHESFFMQIEYYIGFFLLAMLIKKQIVKIVLLRIMMAVSVLMAMFTFYLQGVIISIDAAWKPSYEGIFTNTNFYGYVLTVFTALSAAMFVVEKQLGWRIFSLASLVINTTVLLLNDTMGAWIGSLFGCIFSVIVFRIRDGRVNKSSLVALAVFIVTMFTVGIFRGGLIYNFVSMFVDLSNIMMLPEAEETLHAGSGRWKIWMRSVEMIMQHPLFGLGYEGLVDKDISAYVGHIRSHNEYLQYAVNYGWPGGILYTLWCTSLYIRGLKHKMDLDDTTLACLVAGFAYLVGAFFGVTTYNTTFYLFIMLGLGYVHNRGDITT